LLNLQPKYDVNGHYIGRETPMQEEIDADVCRHAEQALWAAVIHRVWADYFDSGCQACRAA